MDRLPNFVRRSADALKVVLSPVSQSRDVGVPQICSTFREEQLELGVEIGSGAFATVYRGKYLGHDVAVKVLNEGRHTFRFFAQTAPDLTTEIEKEANIIEQKRSKYIVRLLHYSTKKNWIVMEYCENGSLYDVIRNEALKDTVLDWSERLRWMLEVALGMHVVHNEPPTVFHRDFKSSNILIDSHLVAKVGDFGMSKQPLNGLKGSKSDSLGHIRKIWQPIEVIEEGKYSTKSDVYSFGVVMYEVLSLKAPFGFDSDDKLIDQKVEAFVKSRGKLEVPADRSQLPGEWHKCLEKYLDLMHECTEHDPEKRPDFGEISDRLKEIKHDYDRAMVCKETKERLVSIGSTLKCCGIFALVLCFASLVTFSVYYCHSESAFEDDGHEGPAKWTAFLGGILGLLLVFLLLLSWYYKHVKMQSGSAVQKEAESKKHTWSLPFSLVSKLFMNQPGSSSIIKSPFDKGPGLQNQLNNSDASSIVNLPIPAPEVWKDIREGFVCELKGRDDDYLISVARFCRDHTNDELTQREWETLVRIVHLDTKVRETNTWKRFEDHLSVPMYSREAPHVGLLESRSVSGAGPSSAPGYFRQLGNGGSTEAHSNSFVELREEPELDVQARLHNSLPRSLSRCSEVSSSREASSKEERGRLH